MAEISTKSLAQKLGLKAAHRAIVLHPPGGFARTLGILPNGVVLQKRFAGEFDFIISFFESERALKTELPQLKKALKTTGMVWVCWRKGDVTGLNRELVCSLSEKMKFENAGSISISDDWSALKLVLPLGQQKKPPQR